MPYIGAGGREFSSSVLAKASMPGGYTRTITTGRERFPASGRGAARQPSLVDVYSKMGTEAKAANVAREKEIRNLYADILNSISGSNVSLRASGLADIEQRSKQLVGKETQSLISSGLFGTTTAAAVPRQVETGFAQPARLKLEDLLASRKREAQLGLAGFVERIQTPYPDYSALLQAQAAQASV